MGRLWGTQDICFFDHIASELTELAGTKALWFQFEENMSTKDPLYGEVLSSEYKRDPVTGKQGVELSVFFVNPDDTTIVGEEGFRAEKNTTIGIPVKLMRDKGLHAPHNGDIVKVWDLYFDVKVRHRDGIVNDNPVNSMWIVDVVRRTQASPENVALRK